MKRIISYIMMVMPALATLVSCNDEVIYSESHGYLSVCIDNDTTADIVSKADESAEDLVFALEVFNASGNVVASVDDHRTITTENPIKLQIGSYSMVASSGENLNAAFNSPYYEGRTTENFRINPNRTTEVSVTCTLASTCFTVEFPEGFSENFTDYEVSVTNGEGESLVFSNKPEVGNPLEADLDAMAYFAVTGQLTWELSLKNKDGGVYTATETIKDVKAKQHYHLAFEMGEEQTSDGGFVIKINLANNWENTSHEVILDFYQKNMPEVTVNDSFPAVSGESVSVPVGNKGEKILTFNAPEGFRSILLLHDNSVLTEKGLPESVEFVGASSNLISTLASAGFVVTETASITTKSNASVEFKITDFVASLPVGKYQMDFSLVDKRGRCDSFNLIIEVISDVDAEAITAYTGWASFAKLEGRFFDLSKKDDITFQYRMTSETEWNEVSRSSVKVNTSTMTFSTVLYSLSPSTEYVFRAISSEDVKTKEIKFTTESAGTIHNLNFDIWTNDNKFPNASGYNVWDSANSSGVTITTTPVSGNDAVKGNAARLETLKYAGVLAAGNIFTGSFGDFSVSFSGAGASLNWGTPFNSRPIALRGYYKYNPQVINASKKPYKDKEGEMDQGQILIFLTDWNSTFTVNTVSQTFVDLDNDPGIIALGILNPSEDNEDYVEFTIPLEYRSNTRIPKYLVLAGASSRFGDYFTGGVGSILYLDEFELVYDPAELTEAEFNQVFSKVSPF